MNSHTDTTSGDLAATVTVTSEALRRLSMGELWAMQDAIVMASDALTAICQQPRFGVDGRRVLNAAGEEVDTITMFLDSVQEMIMKVARAADPSDPREAEHRAWLLLLYGARHRDDIPDFASLAAQLAAQQSHVEFHARLNGRAEA